MRWLSQTFRLEVDRLRQVPSVADVTIHGDVVLARDTTQVFLVGQGLQRAHTRPIQTARDLYLVSFFDAGLGASRAQQECPVRRFDTAAEVTDHDVLLGRRSDGSLDAIIIAAIHSGQAASLG